MINDRELPWNFWTTVFQNLPTYEPVDITPPAIFRMPLHEAIRLCQLLPPGREGLFTLVAQHNDQGGSPVSPERARPIKGYVFHTTSPPLALKILADTRKVWGVNIMEYPPTGYEGWRSEEEVAVTGKVVYISDCTEILTERDVARKYGFGWKYPYKDVRYRQGTPWRAFSEFMPMFHWEGPSVPRIFRQEASYAQ